MGIKRKTFDCVAMKRRGAEKVQRTTRGMTREAELAFWSRGTAELLIEQKALRQKNKRPRSTSRIPRIP